MKLALFATLVAFGGSLAGFGIASATGPSAYVAAGPPSSSEHVIVGAPAADEPRRDRDCPKPRADRT